MGNLVFNSLFKVQFVSVKKEHKLQELRQLAGITVPLTVIPLKRKYDTLILRNRECRITTVTKGIPWTVIPL